MQANTARVVWVVTGLLLGRLVTLPTLQIIEVTALFLLVAHSDEIWNSIKRFAARPSVRVYVRRNLYIRGLEMSLVKAMGLGAAVGFGGVALIVDAMHRHR
jgi:hypothetical protein